VPSFPHVAYCSKGAFFAYRGITLKFFPTFNRSFSDSPDEANTSMRRQLTDEDLLARSGNGSARNCRGFSRSRPIRERPRGSSPTRRTDRPRVLIVHSSPVTRFGLAILLEESGRFAICAQADAAPTARELFERHQPELVVTGLTLRGGDGIGLIKDFRKLHPTSRTLVLSKRDDALAMQRAFRAGARAYLMAGDETAEILEALDRILAGELYASASVGYRLLENLADGQIKPNDDSKVTSLSDRELQIFSLFGRGFGATQLAAELHLSVKTIETHQMRIKEKLGLRSAAELSKEASLWMSEVARRELAGLR
jgi:DNA-binding NarL/FixJ family response regulator